MTIGTRLVGPFVAHPRYRLGCLVGAPKIRQASAVSCLTLLLGGLAVMRGRRAA